MTPNTRATFATTKSTTTISNTSEHPMQPLDHSKTPDILSTPNRTVLGTVDPNLQEKKNSENASVNNDTTMLLSECD